MKTKLITRIIFALVSGISGIVLTLPVHGDIFFNAKIAGPVTNISRVDDKKTFYAVTPGRAQQDRGFNLGPNNLIAFASNRGATENDRVQATMNVFLMEQITKQKKIHEKITQLSDSKNFSFSPKFSPNGKNLAYISRDKHRKHHFHLFDLKTRESKILFSSEQIVDFMWSKDSDDILHTIANKETSAISIYSIKNGKSIDLVNSAIIDDPKIKGNTEKNYFISATWSPDETKIAFIEHPLEKNRSKTVKIYDKKTQKVTSISKPNQQAQAPLHWHHGGDSILYSGLTNYKAYYDEQLRDKVYEGAMHIYIGDLTGKVTQLTQGNHYHGRPVFSPDGKNIAFLFAEKLGDQRTYKLHSMDSDGKNITKLYDYVYRESFLTWK